MALTISTAAYVVPMFFVIQSIIFQYGSSVHDPWMLSRAAPISYSVFPIPRAISTRDSEITSYDPSYISSGVNSTPSFLAMNSTLSCSGSSPNLILDSS